MFMYDLQWKILIHLVFLLIDFYKNSFFVLYPMNLEILTHVLESPFQTIFTFIIFKIESLVKFSEILVVPFFLGDLVFNFTLCLFFTLFLVGGLMVCSWFLIKQVSLDFA